MATRAPAMLKNTNTPPLKKIAIPTVFLRGITSQHSIEIRYTTYTYTLLRPLQNKPSFQNRITLQHLQSYNSLSAFFSKEFLPSIRFESTLRQCQYFMTGQKNLGSYRL